MSSATGKTIKLLIVDDHKIFRDGVKLGLLKYNDIECVAEAEDGLIALSAIDKYHPDVMILDLQMPNMDGIEVLTRVRKSNLDLKVIILTMHEDEAMITRMMELGANAYLLKNTGLEEIYEAIITCVNENYYVTPLVEKTKISKVLTKSSTPKTISLSEREAAVLKLICEEKTTKEIANELFLSPRTIEGYRDVLLEKTGANSTAGLVMFAVKQGIVTP
jgi:DNA-binding NarL/FixJ family response regulator